LGGEVFAGLTAQIGALAESGFEDGRAMEPPGQAGVGSDGSGLAREGDEDVLGDFFGGGPVAEESKGGAEDEVQVALDQLGEGGFVASGAIGPEELFVCCGLAVVHDSDPIAVVLFGKPAGG
jgi:hypothetical protein